MKTKQYHYVVKAKFFCFDNDKVDKGEHEAYNQDTYVNMFSDENPFLAREAAFRRAESHKEIFMKYVAPSDDLFFAQKKGQYNDYNIQVFFQTPETGEEIKIHDYKSIDISKEYMSGDNIYDWFTIRAILGGLTEEYEILKNNGISLEKSCTVEVIFIKSNNETEIWKKTIFPTEWIKCEKITMREPPL